MSRLRRFVRGNSLSLAFLAIVAAALAGQAIAGWQSEFLAVGTMAIFAVFLRQRGSPESKRVGAAHDATG